MVSPTSPPVQAGQSSSPAFQTLRTVALILHEQGVAPLDILHEVHRLNCRMGSPLPRCGDIIRMLPGLEDFDGTDVWANAMKASAATRAAEEGDRLADAIIRHRDRIRDAMVEVIGDGLDGRIRNVLLDELPLAVEAILGTETGEEPA